MLEDQIAEGRAQGEFVVAWVSHMAGKAEDLGTGAALGSDRTVPCRSTGDDRGNIRQGLDIIHDRRFGEQPLGCRERWPQSWLTEFPL